MLSTLRPCLRMLKMNSRTRRVLSKKQQMKSTRFGNKSKIYRVKMNIRHLHMSLRSTKATKVRTSFSISPRLIDLTTKTRLSNSSRKLKEFQPTVGFSLMANMLPKPKRKRSHGQTTRLTFLISSKFTCLLFPRELSWKLL